MMKNGVATEIVDDHGVIKDLSFFLGEPGKILKQDQNNKRNIGLNDEEKIALIAGHFSEIMKTLGLDMEDDSLRDSPRRVAHMYVKEVFKGLNPENRPKVTLFENKFSYNQMLIEKDITFHSFCEHHFVPMTGKVHVGYISSGKVIGLSKINRIVDFCARRPQLQERLTVEIAQELKAALETENVALVVEANHYCVAARGIQDMQSSTISSHFEGKFIKEEFRKEFLSFLN